MMPPFDKISVGKESKSEVSNTQKSNKLSLDFRYFVYRCIKHDWFTNFFKDEKDYNKNMLAIYSKIIPHIYDKSINEVEKSLPHTHYIKTNPHIDKIKIVLQHCYDNNYTVLNPSSIDTSSDETFFQIGIQSGIRLICFAQSNTLYVLFIDTHHLIYKNDSFNTGITYKYDANHITTDLKVINFETAIHADCYNCDKLNHYLNML